MVRLTRVDLTNLSWLQPSHASTFFQGSRKTNSSSEPIMKTLRLHVQPIGY